MQLMTEKRKRGGQPKPAEAKHERIVVTLPPEQAAWLKAQEGRLSHVISKIVAKAMKDAA